jgi:hypothetical protein
MSYALTVLNETDLLNVNGGSWKNFWEGAGVVAFAVEASKVIVTAVATAAVVTPVGAVAAVVGLAACGLAIGFGTAHALS